VSDYLASLPSDTEDPFANLEQERSDDIIIRSAREIDDLKLDEHDCLLGDRLLSKSGKLVIAGPPGIGKTRWGLQLAAASITGADCCGIETHAEGLRWLVLQTENSNRRLQFDLRNLAKRYGDGFLDHLFIHTIEGDGILSLVHSGSAIERVIDQFRPQFVMCDPTRDFVIGDPNSDRDMTETVFTLGRLCRSGDPMRAIVLIHHALTGKAGISKAAGWERIGYARNSKVLASWARAQINVAPENEDNNDRLVFVCGKNNDGKEFQLKRRALRPWITAAMSILTIMASPRRLRSSFRVLLNASRVNKTASRGSSVICKAKV
jgi:RecA-family ATPase